MWQLSSSQRSPTALWQNLRQGNVVQGDIPPDENAAPLVPWYIRWLQGITGWIAAICLLVFIGGSFATLIFSISKRDFFDSPGIVAIFGLPLCAIAYGLLRQKTVHAFTEQFAFVLSLCGQSLLVLALFILFKHDERNPLLYTLITLFFLGWFVLIPNHLHRVWMMAAGVANLGIVLAALGEPLFPLATAGITWLLAYLVLNRHRFPAQDIYLSPAISGMLWGVITLAGFWLSHTWFYLFFDFWHGREPSTDLLATERVAALSTGLTLLWATWQLLQRYQVPPRRPVVMLALLLAGVIALSTYWMPGLALVVLLIVLGFAHSDRVFLGCGLLSLLVYLNFYYYTLNISLLHKAMILGGLGLVLLITRLLLPRLLGKSWEKLPEEGVDHA